MVYNKIIENRENETLRLFVSVLSVFVSSQYLRKQKARCK
nr:MAG TPA: hypothetical protein [Caudoviricetes sp.]